MACWLCESSDEPTLSNKTPIKDMLLTLYPKMIHRVPKILDFCSSCFLELDTYYNFKLSYNINLKTDASEDEDESFVDLTDESNDFKGNCSVCSKKVHEKDVCFIRECTSDEEESDILAADLIRTYFPQIRLNIPANLLACTRCSELLKGMHEYHQKCSVKTVIDKVIENNTKNESETCERDQDYSLSINHKLPDFGSEISCYRTDAFSASMMNENSSLSSDSNPQDEMKFDDDDDNESIDSMAYQNDFTPTQEDYEKMLKQGMITEKNYKDTITSYQANKEMFTSLKTASGRIFQCECCQYTTNRKDNMRRHVFIRHIKRRAIRKCPYCNLQTPSENVMTKHIEEKHSDTASIRTYNCTVCDFKARTFSHLQNHMKFIHLMEKQMSQVYSCSMCEFMTSREQYLQKHMRYKHANVMIYLNCKFCNFRTRRKDNLRQHVSHMHVKESLEADYFGCHLCGFQSKRKDKLKRHMECLHGEDDKKPCFKCGVCNYSCTRKDTLKRHVEYQHSKKEIIFKCNMCTYQAGIFDYLQKHIKYAHSEQAKMYKCHVCSYTTYKKILFGQHYRRRHGCAPPLELDDGCECNCNSGGYNSSCIKCRNKADETEVICLDDESETYDEEIGYSNNVMSS